MTNFCHRLLPRLLALYTVVNNIIKTYFKPEGRPQRGIYLALYEAIKEAIDTGALPEHTAMPPTRLLMTVIGLSRSTVVKAYNLLAENQLLVAKQGSGFAVATLPKLPLKIEVDPVTYPAISDLGQSFLHNIHLLNDTSAEGIAFTPGLPPLDVFPIGQWQKLSNMYWRNIRSADLNYSISSGIDSLKKCIANYLLLSRGITCDPGQIMIVSGSLQSLFLIGSVLINKGDMVCMENPTFPNVISIFKSLQADVVPIEVDNEGLIIDQINSDEHKAVKLIHTTPSNQYPLGGKMSKERRLKLLAWAHAHNAMIIENDYEHEINNWHDQVPSIYSLDAEQRTIYLGTFNRILHPSIRLGYMIVPPHLLPAVKALQMHSHRFVPQSIQVVMTDFMSQNLIYKHIRMAIEEAKERRALFLSLFQKHFDDQIQIRPVLTSSFHLVAELPADRHDEKLVAALDAKGIATHALSKCYFDHDDQYPHDYLEEKLTEPQPKPQGLILGYSCINQAFMTPTVQKMAGVYLGKKWW